MERGHIDHDGPRRAWEARQKEIAKWFKKFDAGEVVDSKEYTNFFTNRGTSSEWASLMDSAWPVRLEAWIQYKYKDVSLFDFMAIGNKK